MKRRRDINIFSLSFLDAICCGFGAIIILFVLSEGGEPLLIQRIQEDLSGLLERLKIELYEVRGQTTVLNQDLQHKREQLSEEEARLARLRGDLSTIQGEFAGSTAEADVQNTIEGKLAEAYQELTEEMRRLLSRIPDRPDNPIGGVPIDSEYIIFIIDTSGSMQTHAWPLVQKKMQEILEIYPTVKGIQVMNDMGAYMFSHYQDRWIPDSPGRRRAILSTMRGWRPFSNSSPVEGLARAIRTFYAPNKKISIYVLGDEFSGSSMQPVLSVIDHINRENESGERLVRIHAVGFPVMFQDEVRNMAGNTGERFATLMRAVCERNGGAFVGLNSLRP
jgi:hypothetical protein